MAAAAVAKSPQPQLQPSSSLSSYLHLNSTGTRVASDSAGSAAAKSEYLSTLRSGGHLNATGGMVPDWADKWSNPKAVALMSSFRPQSAAAGAGTLVTTNTAAVKALSASGPVSGSGVAGGSSTSRSGSSTGRANGVVYTDALRWYKPPPGEREILPKALRLAPTARPQTVPATSEADIDRCLAAGTMEHLFAAPVHISKRRFPDLNLPFTPVEQPPTAKYTAIHSAQMHGINNAIPNPLAASKNASRAAYFQSSSIAANAAIAKRDGSIALASDDQKIGGADHKSHGKGAGNGSGSAANGSGSGSASPKTKTTLFAASDVETAGAVPTRVNYKRRSFVARQFFHTEGHFESAGGVTHAYRYFQSGSRPFGGAPRAHVPSKTTESGYRYDCYTGKIH